jgi:predicted AAA+ superfamily ATPase
MIHQTSIFYGSLPESLVHDIESLNPWWRNKPGTENPGFRRWLFPKLRHQLTKGLTKAVVLRGPRRVGKTVLTRQLIEALLGDGVAPNRILYVSFDDIESLRDLQDSVLAISRWFETYVLEKTFNESARSGETAYLFFDEVQNLSAWDPQIKHLVDNHDVRVLITGSSSLRIEAGRDSLAGRITTLDLGPMLLREIASLRSNYNGAAYWPDNGLENITHVEFWRGAVHHGSEHRAVRERAFEAFSARGAYPISHESGDRPWVELADYLNETVIRRALQHDLRLGSRGQKRDEKLLEEVFRLCCRYAGQTSGRSVFEPEIHHALAGAIGWNRILNYMRFLDGTLLLRLIQPLEIRGKKKGKSPAKICLCDHALRASWLQEVVPLAPQELLNNPHLSDLAGHLAESVLGYFLAGIPNLDVAHFPTRGAEPEVDFILTIGTKRIPVEVKYRKRIDPHEDTRGLRAFLEKTVYNAPFGLLVTLNDDAVIHDPRIIPISLSSLLWMR